MPFPRTELVAIDLGSIKQTIGELSAMPTHIETKVDLLIENIRHLPKAAKLELDDYMSIYNQFSELCSEVLAIYSNLLTPICV